MQDSQFKRLIVDSYKKSKEGNLVGVLHGASLTCGFSDISDINEFVDLCNPDMLHIRSRSAKTEADVYLWELEDYKIKSSENMIYVKLKTRKK